MRPRAASQHPAPSLDETCRRTRASLWSLVRLFISVSGIWPRKTTEIHWSISKSQTEELSPHLHLMFIFLLFYFLFFSFVFTTRFHSLTAPVHTLAPAPSELPLCLKQEMSPEVISTSPSPNLVASNLAISVSGGGCNGSTNNHHFPNTFNSFSHHAPVYGQFSSQSIISGNAAIHLISACPRVMKAEGISGGAVRKWLEEMFQPIQYAKIAYFLLFLMKTEIFKDLAIPKEMHSLGSIHAKVLLWKNLECGYAKSMVPKAGLKTSEWVPNRGGP